MKNTLLVLTVALTLASCHSGKTSKREVIDPGAATGLVFLSDSTTLRIHNELSDINPKDALKKNIAYCKASIASTIFNGVEDCCVYYIDNYASSKEMIDGVSNIIIKEFVDDAIVSYNKTATPDGNSYTSIITLELKKDKLLKEIETAFIEENIVDTANAEALRKAIDKRLTPKY